MSKKSKLKVEKEQFDGVITSLEKDHIALKTPHAQMVKFLIIGVIAAAAPVVLYTTPILDGNVSANLVYYIGGVILTGGLLGHAYNALASRARKQLFISRDPILTLNENRSEADSRTLVATRTEAEMYALFTVNLIYVILFLFTAFYVVRPGSMAGHWSFLSATLAPSAICMILAKKAF